MGTPAADWLALTALVFVLGLRHGFDPDHLVAIDGLARSSRSRAWLQAVGTWISVGVLLALGVANLTMALRTPADRGVPLGGIRSRWFAEQLARSSHPAFIALIGAAFALSFDTISHALVFSLSGSPTG